MNESKEIRSHRDLKVWQRGLDLVDHVYSLTARFPEQEKYALASQMRRAAVSVPSNIAEGKSRQYRTEYRQFLYNALGSLAELDTQRTIALRQGDFSAPSSEALEDEILKLRNMIMALALRLRRVRKNKTQNPKPKA